MIPKSSELRFEVTTKCNYNCIICPREKLTRKKETMALKLFEFLLEKIINETSQFDTISFPGMGEPLLDESIDHKIAYAKKKGFTVLMLTNASMLSLERFKKLEALGLDSIRVSMYGGTPESYRAVHRPNGISSYEKIKDNLTQISAIKKGTKLLLTYNVINKYNESSLNSWIKYWENKVDLLEVWRPHNWVNVKHYRNVQEHKLKTCGRPWNTPLQIQVDGTINMCCFDFNGKLLLGNLKTQTLKEVFESPMFLKILEHHTSGDYTGSTLICEDCDQRNADKSDVMIYNSKFDIMKRVHQVSTTYKNVL